MIFPFVQFDASQGSSTCYCRSTQVHQGLQLFASTVRVELEQWIQFKLVAVPATIFKSWYYYKYLSPQECIYTFVCLPACPSVPAAIGSSARLSVCPFVCINLLFKQWTFKIFLRITTRCTRTMSIQPNVRPSVSTSVIFFVSRKNIFKMEFPHKSHLSLHSATFRLFRTEKEVLCPFRLNCVLKNVSHTKHNREN